jgi:predicted outer membrane repeat protein
MMKNIRFAFIALAGIVLIIIGCSNPFAPSRSSGPKGGVSGDMQEGFGSVSIVLAQGGERTAMPAYVLNEFDHIDYLFAKGGAAAQALTPDGDGSFMLEHGSWTITVKAYVMPGSDSLAAEGTETLDLAGGTHASLAITMRPVTDGEGVGSFKFLLAFPNDAVIETFTLTRIAGDEELNLKALFNDAVSGEKNDVPVGYYLARVVLKRTVDSVWAYARATEIVHIYQNMITETDPVRFAFTADDFDARRVTNTDNAGPGSLRQAILDAKEDQVVQVLLPPGSVIELSSGLSINKSLTIEGNGIVITRGPAFPPTVSVSSGAPLLTCSGSNKTITIRRVHFKDGMVYDAGGAISKTGTAHLIVESCIFSGNRTASSSSFGGGGAIYTGEGALTVRACTFYKNSAAGRGGAIHVSTGTTVSLSGNLFYGNTAGASPALHLRTEELGYNGVVGTISSGGFNICDAAIGSGANESGWTAALYDTTVMFLPLSGKTFRPFEGGGALGKLPAALPSGYPALDFYGGVIPPNGASGAVQSFTAMDGFFLDLSVNKTILGGADVTGLSEDGLASGPVTLTAAPSAFSRFRRWDMDGSPVSTDNPYTLTLSAHAAVRAVFDWEITDLTDSENAASTPGSLRYALVNASSGEIVHLAGVTPGITTIGLSSPLQMGSGIFEGNGVTLTRGASFPTSGATPLLSASGGVIRRVHFKNGRSYGMAAANGTLESCIFSGNWSSGSGWRTTIAGGTVRGCTFFNNKVEDNNQSESLLDISTITGNIFFGNISNGWDRLTNNASGNESRSGGYNICDVVIGKAMGQSGFAAAAGDTQISSWPMSYSTFRLLPGSAALNRLPSPLPANYPTVDFYGDPILPGGAAGAVQVSVNGSGYLLNLSVTNPLLGSAGVTGLTEDGLAAGPVTLTATPSAMGRFQRWELDGALLSTANPYAFTPSVNGSIRAVFGWNVTDLSDDANAAVTPVTLRYALANAENGDVVNLIGVTPGVTVMELNNSLAVSKSITIEGNGITFTRGPNSPAGGFAMLSVSSTTTVRRIHFTEGLSSGAAAISGGGLILESCIFSGTRSTNAAYGAVSGSSIAVRGCTFYNNGSGGRGGAISASSATLMGNLFIGNAVTGGTSGGYNGSDLPYGTEVMQIGFNAGPGDVQIPMSIHPLNFRPLSGGGALTKLPNSLPQGYPSVDFYGDVIGPNGAIGAVQTPVNTDQYYLEIQSSNASRGYAESVSGIDADGFGSGSVTVEAIPYSPGVLLYWELNGAKVGQGMNPYTFNLTAHSAIRAVFGLIVSDHTDNPGSGTTPGTLRYALVQAMAANDIITIEGVTPGTTEIELSASLAVNKSVIIEGNGITLKGYPVTVSGQTTLRRVHFKDAPVSRTASLILESCIFSGSAGISGSASLTIRGCTFYRNGAIAGSPSFAGSIFYGTGRLGGTSGGYNVCDVPLGTAVDQSGFAPALGDTFVPAPVVHSASFKPLPSGGTLNKLPAQLPANYPTVDFYGALITGGGAAGAAQTPEGTGNYLEITVNYSGLGSVSAPGLSAEGFGSGTVSVTANPVVIGQFLHWELDGANAGNQNPLNVALNTHRRIRAVFGWKVWDFTDTAQSQSTPGTLRYAVANAASGGTIWIEGGGPIIPLARRLIIEKNLTIEGNGVTLSSASATVGVQTQLLYVYHTSDSLNVTLRRIHFKNGRASNYGGAIYNNGETLVLESCIFSGNMTTTATGAVYIAGNAAIRGCTFYDNGRAVYLDSGTLSLAGNLFYENGQALYRAGGTASSGGYNVYDGTGGFTAIAGDTPAFSPLIDTAYFNPLSTGAAHQAIAATPPDYPGVDFYGDPIPALNAMAGAVQVGIVSSGYMLDYEAQGLGQVAIKTGGPPDSYGLYSGSVTLLATPAEDSAFTGWTVNGTPQEPQSPANELTLSMDGHKTVRAVFVSTWTVTNGANSGTGSLRYAVDNALAGDSIVFQAQTVTLTAALTIDKNLIIEGNGATLTQTGLVAAFLNISANTEIRISRLRFTGGRSYDEGAAIKSAGNLTLESCIFSNNSTADPGGGSYVPSVNGGAIYSTGPLTVLGCTFTGNSAATSTGGNGGAICQRGGTLSLTGNIFVGNTGGRPVVSSNPAPTTNGYNVSDKPGGTGNGQSGWGFAATDVELTDVQFSPDYKPSSAMGLPVIPSLPAVFPATYFDGSSRGSGSTPGAMPLN